MLLLTGIGEAGKSHTPQHAPAVVPNAMTVVPDWFQN